MVKTGLLGANGGDRRGLELFRGLFPEKCRNLTYLVGPARPHSQDCLYVAGLGAYPAFALGTFVEISESETTVEYHGCLRYR